MSQDAASSVRRQFVHYHFYHLDPAWLRLGSDERERSKAAFEAVVEHYAGAGMIVIPYTLVGVRGGAEMMLWRISYELEALREMSTAIRATPLGGYLSEPHAYLSMSKRSTYVDKLDPEHGEQRAKVQPGRFQYCFVYPFVKKREWYQLPLTERQRIMDEHIAVGNQYPTVKLNTTYSFGLDDQEFMLAFETNAPADFLDLVMALRETESSRYTERDTPIFTCLRTTVRGMLEALGG
ncbi:MAG: chlorite dismutase family protein [Armatimonadetes bacterium]|nr:chlorite dismutase family protein [Armatimonadota bacterium]